MLGCEALGFGPVAFFGLPLVSFIVASPVRIENALAERKLRSNGRGVSTGAAYEQRYVSLIRLKEKEIVLYRDYWNPLSMLRALGGDAFAQTLERDGSWS